MAGTQRGRTSSGVHFPSGIPVIGGLFGRKGRKGRKTNDFELFVFITPHVIYSDDDLEEAAEDVRRNRPALRRATDRLRPMIDGEVSTDPTAEENPQRPDAPPEAEPPL